MSLAEKFKTLEGCFDADLCVQDSVFGGIYAKKMELPAGYFAISHKHNYDHMSILAKGKCLLVTDSGEVPYTAPAMIHIPKDLHHEIVAIDDVLWFCLHSTDSFDDIDSVLIKKGDS